ncbi:hypothetical protein [Haladaptatus salinisoli]|uniref:hypothetical protein n=1 Tax=Haladaptatus salinisoli TaxID=2884876 RepID=UPI001D0AA527|nr:hypothetical protein [Haladaptatus salinisoli]
MSAMELVTALVAQVIVVPIQFVSFWVSVTLPLFYVPLLFTELRPGASIFVVLLAIHLLSLMVGHGYGREETPRSVNVE